MLDASCLLAHVLWPSDGRRALHKTWAPRQRSGPGRSPKPHHIFLAMSHQACIKHQAFSMFDDLSLHASRLVLTAASGEFQKLRAILTRLRQSGEVGTLTAVVSFLGARPTRAQSWTSKCIQSLTSLANIHNSEGTCLYIFE